MSHFPSRVAIIGDENEHVDRRLQRQHLIPDTNEIRNQWRMPNFQNQGREGSPFVCCGRSSASARQEGAQAASGCLSLPEPGILMSNTSDSFMERGGYPMYLC